MKTLKRILAILSLFIAILAVSYIVYTAKQIPPENAISEVLHEMAKRLNIALTIALTVAFILLGAFVFRLSYLRGIEALTDLFGSIKYYFCKIFDLPTSEKPAVSELSKVIKWDLLLPENFETFKANFIVFWKTFASKENFLAWLKFTGEKAGGFSKIILLILPCLFALFMAVKTFYNKPNIKHNQDTLPLKIYKKITLYSYVPIRDFLKQYYEYVKQHSAIWIVWLVLWTFNLNIASIIIAFFAYYFYFAVTFDFGSFYVQFVKAVTDLQVIVKYVPFWAICIVAWLGFEHWRKNLALAKLRRMEMSNRGFINDLPIVSMTCGSMGKKKTTIITDMALSQEVMFRSVAYDKLQKTDMKFPNFGWIAFEMELRKCMEHGVVYNLATIKEWVNLKRQRYEKHHNDAWQLFGYDSCRYGLYYTDGLRTSYIFDVLSTYAQLYFIYVIQSSLLVSNYSIREDNLLIDEGNFPMWSNDFFKRKNVRLATLTF